jgi:hypothetical protein
MSIEEHRKLSKKSPKKKHSASASESGLSLQKSTCKRELTEGERTSSQTSLQVH